MLGNSPVVAMLPCVDVEGARKFYGEVLGLTEESIPGADVAADSGMLFECGAGTRLLVYQRSTPTTADHTAAGWFVDDIDAVADELLAKGVKFEVYDMPGMDFDSRGVATMGSNRGVWFKDPEGNILSISNFS